MPDYLILGTSQKNDRSVVVVHTTTPGGTNTAGVTWVQCLIDQLDGQPFDSLVPASVMPAGRQAALDAGTVFEWSFTSVYDANDSAVAKQTEVENQIQAKEADILTEKQNELRFWGHTGTVA